MTLPYTEKGSGNTTLVFLHYFGGAGSTWDEVISYLKDKFHCIAIDLLGFGKSPSQEKLISVADSANAIMEVINHLQLTDYVLIGHSMGGKIAIDIAAKQPKNLQSLVLVAPSPPTLEPMTEKERQSMDDAFGKREAIEKMITSVTAEILSPQAFEKEVANNLAVSQTGWHSWPQVGSKEDISNKMKEVKIPLHVVYGGQDKKFTKDFLQKEYSRYFPSFTLQEVENSGHLIPVEAPQKLAQIIRRLASAQFIPER